MAVGRALMAGASALASLVAGCGDGAQMPRGEPYLDRGSAIAAAASVRAAQRAEWPAPRRIAYLAGHAAAALELARLGALTEAAERLAPLHDPAYETLRAGLAIDGFSPEVFAHYAAALTGGQDEPAARDRATTGKDALIAMLVRTGAADAVGFLMDQTAEHYALGVENGAIKDIAAYQQAYGFARAAQEIAQQMETDGLADLKLELQMLELMWPSAGPVKGAAPPPSFEIASQIARVRLALATLP